jgi:hypothetical protein
LRIAFGAIETHFRFFNAFKRDTKKFIDYTSNMVYTQINLLIEGRFLETILKAEQAWRPATTGS